MSRERSCLSNEQLFICPAMDSIQGWPLTLAEYFSLASKSQRGGGKQDEHDGLPDLVILSVGMNVKVMFNVETDLDLANGAWGKIVRIILNGHKSQFLSSELIIHLGLSPVYVVITMLSTYVAYWILHEWQRAIPQWNVPLWGLCGSKKVPWRPLKGASVPEWPVDFASRAWPHAHLVYGLRRAGNLPLPTCFTCITINLSGVTPPPLWATLWFGQLPW